MRKGAKSFVEFSAFTVPAVLGFAYLTGTGAPLIALLGVFFVLQCANKLDRRS
jgi:hypothetical protein